MLTLDSFVNLSSTENAILRDTLVTTYFISLEDLWVEFKKNIQRYNNNQSDFNNFCLEQKYTNSDNTIYIFNDCICVIEGNDALTVLCSQFIDNVFVRDYYQRNSHFVSDTFIHYRNSFSKTYLGVIE